VVGVQQDHKGLKDQRDHKGLKDHRVHRDQRVKETLDLPDLLEHMLVLLPYRVITYS
jgi:hypothetical protein